MFYNQLPVWIGHSKEEFWNWKKNRLAPCHPSQTTDHSPFFFITGTFFQR